MFALSAAGRFLLDAVIALALAPLVVEAAIVSRRRRGSAMALVALAVAAWLSIAFVAPRQTGVDAADLTEAIGTAGQRGDPSRGLELAILAVQQSRGRMVLPSAVPESLLGARRIGELQYYFGGLLARGADVSTFTDLLILARTARQSGWDRTDALDRVTARAAAQPDLRAAAAILAFSVGVGATHAATDAMFANGARAASAKTPAAVFDGWSAHDAGLAQCDVIVFFTPEAPLAGDRVWLHAYPPGSHEYVDVGASFPSSDWKAGELAWEVFRLAAPRGSRLYAGVAASGTLGPAADLGSLPACGAPAIEGVRR
jgi:hypothetical protein